MKLQELVPHWAGVLYGTNTGRLHLALDQEREGDEGRTGKLRISDDHLGVTNYAVRLTLNDLSIAIEGQPLDQVEGVAQGVLSASASADDMGTLHGEWETTIGTGGTFLLHPHHGADIGSLRPTAEQTYASHRDLGALRLYLSDVQDILANLRRKFPSSRIVVSFNNRGAELAVFDQDFEARLPKLEDLDWLRLSVQDQNGQGQTRSVTIDLGANVNRVTTQGSDEAWVLGEVEATASSLRRRQQRFSTAIGKQKFNINFLIFLGALIAMPELPLIERAVFLFSVVLLILAATKLTTLLAPNFEFDTSEKRPGILKRIWPSAVSWVISLTSAVGASFLFDWLM